jgi:DNA replication protein DnaC
MLETAMVGRTVRYLKASDLFRSIRGTFRKDGPSEIKLLETFSRYGLLVIDESHERGDTEFENRTLVHIIDRRYDAGRDTLLISNLSADAFRTSMGPSIISRMSETGLMIVADWPSYRVPGQTALRDPEEMEAARNDRIPRTTRVDN